MLMKFRHLVFNTLFFFTAISMALTTNALATDKGILFNGKFFCEEKSAKAFSVNGEISNVKMNGEGYEVEIKKNRPVDC